MYPLFWSSYSRGHCYVLTAAGWRLRSRFLVQFFCELSCPNRREFIRKFCEFAPRGTFQARIRGDFSPIERNRASAFAETLLCYVVSAICSAAS
jgi:hypothetical protein